jgi:hypothetical protein
MLRTLSAGLVSSAITVMAGLLVPANAAAGAPPSGKVHKIKFELTPNPAFVKCLARYPDDASRPPKAEVVVTRGELNDRLVLRIKNIKPKLAFDLFTVQRSPLSADGASDPQFKGSFGLAWYQSDVEADEDGDGIVVIKTILLDQIFGFDPDVSLPPTNTFHVGFWFNDPNDAAPCGFDPNKPTPFNGEHKAGPLAMISLPDATTGLGPLCTDPNTSTDPATCNP